MTPNYSSRTKRTAEERLEQILYHRFPGLNEERELAIIDIVGKQSVFGPDDQDVIERLLGDEISFFLDTRDTQTASPPPPVEDEITAVAIWLTAFFAYREELEDMDPPAVATLYFKMEQERVARVAAIRAEQDRHEFFNEDPAAARFGHWLALGHWTADETVAISMGKDPSIVNRSSLHYPNAQSPFVREYRRRTEQITRAQAAGQIDPLLRPQDFLQWATRIAKWKIPSDLQDSIAQTDLSEELVGRSRGTFYSLIVAMAVCHYGLDPKKGGPFSSIGQAMADDMNEVGLAMSGRGIDEILKRAFPEVDDGRLKQPSKAWRERRKKSELP